MTLKVGDTFPEGPNDIHTVGRNASSTRPARFVVFLIKKEGRSNPDPGEAAESLTQAPATPVHLMPKVESGNWHRFLWLRRAPFDDPKADIDDGLRNDLAAAPVQ